MNASPTPVLVHLGCGPFAVPSHWQDFDGSWNAWINRLPRLVRRVVRGVYGASGRTAAKFPEHVRYLNLCKPLPFADNSVDGIYASHVWEHLYFTDAERATRECHRVLRPGGTLRLVVPDLRLYCEEYVRRRGDPAAARDLHRQLLYREEARPRSRLLRLYTALTDFHSHKFMYDEDALRALLVGAGFPDAMARKYLETGIAHLDEVESAERIEAGAGFAIEATKAPR